MKDTKQLEALKTKLQGVRKASLSAITRGDCRAVAKLTVEAANLNKTIAAIAGPIWENGR